MSDTKLEKVNKRVHHEPQKDRRPLKWEKELESLSVILTDMCVSLDLSISRPETSLSPLLGERIGGHKETGKEEPTWTGKDKSEDNYYENIGWRITATMTGSIQESLTRSCPERSRKDEPQ